MTPEDVAKVRQLLTDERPEIHQQGLELAESFGDYSAIFEGCSISKQGKLSLSFGPINPTILRLLSQLGSLQAQNTVALDVDRLEELKVDYVLSTGAPDDAAGFIWTQDLSVSEGKLIVALVNPDSDTFGDACDLVEAWIETVVCSLGLDEDATGSLQWTFCSPSELSEHPLAEDYGDYLALQGGDAELRTLLATQDDALFICTRGAQWNWYEFEPTPEAEQLASLWLAEVWLEDEEWE